MASLRRQPNFLFRLILLLCFAASARWGAAQAGRFDLTGPRIEVKVTRGGVTLPVASVPNLQPGDRVWLHPDLPESQSVHYLLICVFLRGTTNPPPDEWFTRIETWDRHVREEGVFVTVPDEAQQAVLFMAPETGGDFSTLKSTVKGHPGVFVRAQQDLIEAGFEQARIEKYLTDIRRVPPTDAADLQKHSDLLARTLALKPNPTCFQQPVDMQFTCLTQAGSQSLLDDSHAQSIVQAMSNGPQSDFINQASTTKLAGAGVYSAYVGTIIDLVRIMGNIHTAQYQYIPAISFPQAEAMNLRLNAPPSFKNPKSVLVIGLPAVQPSVVPPLRPADAAHTSCLLEPRVTLPIEGAPLVFSTAFAHDMVLHLNVPPGAPAEKDIPLSADAYQGGLVLQTEPRHHVELVDDAVRKPEPIGVKPVPGLGEAVNKSADAPAVPPPAPQPEPVTLTGTVRGRWGFDPFTGPEVKLQQLPGNDWHIVASADKPGAVELIAGHSATMLLSADGTACVHTITAHPPGAVEDLALGFKPTPTPEHPELLTVSLPLEHAVTPGDLHLAITQFGQPKADTLAARTFSEPAHVAGIDIHAGDKVMTVTGSRLSEIASVALGDLNFTLRPDGTAAPVDAANTLKLSLAPEAPAPPTNAGDHLTAKVTLQDGRTFTMPITVGTGRPVVTLLRKTVELPPNPAITLTNPNDLPLNATLRFTLKSPGLFPRNGRVEIETVDGTLRTVLTLAPSGGLLLQDPHTIVATLDPQSSFGPSAFGELRMRAVYPLLTPVGQNPATPEETPTSDWLPLATLVRLPTLSLLTCPADQAAACTVDGTNLFLIAAVSNDPAFAAPQAVPDGYTGTTLTVPHTAANTLFLKLRDDPAPVDSANLPGPPPVAPGRGRGAARTAARAGAPVAPDAPSPDAATPSGTPQSPASSPQSHPKTGFR